MIYNNINLKKLKKILKKFKIDIIKTNLIIYKCLLSN